MDIVDIVSELSGMSYNASESATVTVLILLVAALIRVVYFFLKQDSEQQKMETRLVNITGGVLEENKLLRESYQKNILVIEEHTQILRGIQSVLSSLGASMGSINANVTELKVDSKSILSDIQNNLLRKSKTTVVIVDSDEEVLAECTITPEEDGKLVVRFNSVL